MPNAWRLVPVALVVLACALLAACDVQPSSVPGSLSPEPVPATAGPSVDGPASGTPEPVLTPVPGGITPEPEPPEPQPPEPGGGTTITDWGRILDRVPDGFPVYPGAVPADGVGEPVSGAWLAEVAPAAVAAWYAATFEERGWSFIDLGAPLEDGTQVLDLASDLPECRVQATFRPAGGSTMILVLYGAGCAGGSA